MDIAQFTATIGIVAVVTIIVEAVKRAAQWSSDSTQRWAPLLAIFLGSVLNTLLFVLGPTTVRTGEDVLLSALFGLVQGAAAVGLYNAGAKAVIVAVAGPANPAP